MNSWAHNEWADEKVVQTIMMESGKAFQTPTENICHLRELPVERHYVIYFIMRGRSAHNSGQLVVDWAERKKKEKRLHHRDKVGCLLVLAMRDMKMAWIINVK